MSYSLQAYAVDTDRLRAAYGSNDRTLLAAVREDQDDELKSNRRSFKDEIAAGAPTLWAAVKEIVAGAISAPPGAGFQYGYAVEVLCRQCGEELEQEGELGFLSDLGIETKLLTSGPPLPIPVPADFPEIGYLTAAEVADEYARFVASGIGATDDEFTESRAELLGHMARAVELKVGLVTFVY